MNTNDNASPVISARTAVLFVLLTAALLFIVRASAPANFLDKDQERPASYILDVLQNGHWICQKDWTGDVTSKPPLLTWIGAAFALVIGAVTPITLYLPSALSLLGLSLLTLRYGTSVFSRLAGLFAALIVLLLPVSVRLFILLRTDALFALTVGIAAFTAYDTWIQGRKWTAFWLAAAIACMSKGPFGLILAAGGLAAAFWERHAPDAKPLKGNHLPGLILFLVILLGWFFLSIVVFGDAVTNKLLKVELYDQAVNGETPHALYVRFFIPFIYFLHRFLPWSLFACAGFWRVVFRPAEAAPERRFERFLFCWFFVGLLFFSLVQHQRGDLLSPLIPPAALLAGRELARLVARFEIVRVLRATAVIIVLLLGQVYYYYHFDEARSKLVVQTGEIEQLSDLVRGTVGRAFPIVHVDAPFTLQTYLNTMRPTITRERATELLAGSNAVFAAVSAAGAEQIAAALAQRGLPVHIVARSSTNAAPAALILSNRPRLAWTPDAVFCSGPVVVTLRNVHAADYSETMIALQPAGKDSSVRILNTGEKDARLRVQPRPGDRFQPVVLPPNGDLTMAL